MMFTYITSAAYLLTQFIPFMVLLWEWMNDEVDESVAWFYMPQIFAEAFDLNWATSICVMVLSAVVFPVYVYVMTIAWCIYQLINREG